MRVDAGTIPLPTLQPQPLRPQSPPSDAPMPVSGGSFAELLGNALQQVNEAQLAAQHAIQQVSTGDTDDLHDAIVAVETADLSLRLAAQVTQRALQAYQEIARMQI